MGGCYSSKTRPSLVKPPCKASPEAKDYRFVKPENCVRKLNIHTELGYLWGRHTQRIDKAPLHKNNKEKKKNYFLTKKSAYDILLLRSSALILKTTLSSQENHWFVVTSFIIAE